MRENIRDRILRKRYPVISAFCRMAGIDPATDPIPVRPAVHYHMGGIAVDIEGRSTGERPLGLR